MSLVGMPYYHDTVSQTGDPVVEVRGHPVTVTFGMAFNPTGAQVYLQMFNKRAADITLGTTLPDFVQFISPGDNDPIAGGLLMTTALCVAATTTATGNTAAVCKLSLGLS